jgi:hypothetical protein
MRFARTTFNSFWGQFGWMAAPMPEWVYGPLLLFSLATIGGLLLLVAKPTINRRGSTDAVSETTGAGRDGVHPARPIK